MFHNLNYSGCHLDSRLCESSPTFDLGEVLRNNWIESGVTSIDGRQVTTVSNPCLHHVRDILSNRLVEPPIKYLLVGGGVPLDFLCGLRGTGSIHPSAWWWSLFFLSFDCSHIWYLFWYLKTFCIWWCLSSCMFTNVDHFLRVDG